MSHEELKTIDGRSYGQYSRFRWMKYDTPEEAIAANVVHDGECLIWQGPFNGYPKRNTPVFRFGPFTTGWRAVRMWVDPYRRAKLSVICGDHRCVAVAHLTPVPTSKYTSEPQYACKITPDQRAELLDLWKRRIEIHKELRGLTLKALGKRYGVTRERIRQILVDHELQPASAIGVGASDDALEAQEARER